MAERIIYAPTSLLYSPAKKSAIPLISAVTVIRYAFSAEKTSDPFEHPVFV